jgi:hypothetical protein
VIVLPVLMIVLVRVTRDYAHKYAQPVIVPGGIPVDLDAIARRQHEEAMGTASAANEPKLVQILPAAGSANGGSSQASETKADEPLAPEAPRQTPE